MKKRGLNEGVPNHELIDESGNVIGILDLAWPQGIQNGLSERIAILLNETADVQATVSKYGYRYYTSIEEFKEYIRTRLHKRIHVPFRQILLHPA
ncbi:hypothetical protein [uncultured Ruminococcus sp.]|nr:hypothetical protein [uncultured Ruminococcus sp.]